MTALKHIASIDKDALHNIARQACERIAPSWPLDQMIAVNPLWERRDQLWATVAEQLWPNTRSQNSHGQVFHLGAGIAGRMLRKCRAVVERSRRQWEILED